MVKLGLLDCWIVELLNSLWSMEYGVWSMEYGVWRSMKHEAMEHGTWNMEYYLLRS
jgi:hypothetical protein